MTGTAGSAQGQVHGMDTDEGRRVARDMDAGAGQIGGVIGSAQSLASRIQQIWPGGDGERFARDMDAFVAGANNAVQSLSGQAQQLVQHADRQDQASS